VRTDRPSPARASYEKETRGHYQDENVARTYHEQFAAGFSLRRLSHVLVARAEQRAVRRLLEAVRSEFATIADVPCGTGKLSPVFRDLGVSVVGGDVSAAMMQIARADNRTERSYSGFVRLDIVRLPFRARTFDAVVCLRLLHRIPDEVKVLALRELLRVTGHYAVVSYGIANAWHTLRQQLRRSLVGGSTVPHPIPSGRVKDFFGGLGWRVVKRLRPLPILSAEEIVLLVKANPGEGSGPA